MEEELFNAFKYANVSGMGGPRQMIQGILNNVEIMMLKRMQSQINIRMAELNIQTSEKDQKDLDPFVILGVGIDATKDEVLAAWKDKAKTAHPDMGGTQTEMAMVNAAKEAIFLFKGWK